MRKENNNHKENSDKKQNERSSQNLQVPYEILLNILEFGDHKSTFHLMLTCHELNKALSTENQLWYNHYQKKNRNLTSINKYLPTMLYKQELEELMSGTINIVFTGNDDGEKIVKHLIKELKINSNNDCLKIGINIDHHNALVQYDQILKSRKHAKRHTNLKEPELGKFQMLDNASIYKRCKYKKFINLYNNKFKHDQNTSIIITTFNTKGTITKITLLGLDSNGKRIPIVLKSPKSLEKLLDFGKNYCRPGTFDLKIQEKIDKKYNQHIETNKDKQNSKRCVMS